MKKKFFITVFSFLFFCAPCLWAQNIGLSSYIKNIRNEFIELGEKKDDKLPIYVEKVHIEMSVDVKAEGKTGIKFYVLEAGVDASKQSTQKLSFDIYFNQTPSSIRLMSMAPTYSPGYPAATALPAPAGWLPRETFSGAVIYSPNTNKWNKIVVDEFDPNKAEITPIGKDEVDALKKAMFPESD